MRLLLVIYRMKNFFTLFYKIYKLFFDENKRAYEELLMEKKSDELIITNSLGGGTLQFLKNFTKDSDFIILENISYGRKDFVYILRSSKTNHFCFFNLKNLKMLISKENFSRIYINNFVSNNKLFYIQDVLIQNNFAQMIFFVHDFYLICPCYMLFNDNHYCELKFCNSEKCLKNFSKNYNFWWKPKVNSIKEWRKRWSIFLEKMYEIRCFSDNSKNYVKSIYPNIYDKITVVPHSMDYCNINKIEQNKQNVINVGIVGSFTSAQKGKDLITDLLKYSRKKTNIKFTVIGDYKKIIKLKSKNIKYIGHYSSTVELENILRSNEITVLFFPSIWPETFSYLISELMLTNLPIVTFNLGAQAEKIKKYNKGVICEKITNAAIITALERAANVE